MTARIRLKARSLAIVLVAASVASCGETDHNVLVGPNDASESIQVGPQDEMLTLGREIALALGTTANGASLRNHMRQSVFPEHKLPIVRYLRGVQGQYLRQAMKSSGEVRPDELLKNLPELELYFPVRRHRDTWTDGDDLIVVVDPHYDDYEGPLTAFRLDGSRLVVSGETPPDIPALVLTLAETDFDEVPDRQGWVNVNDRNGASVGSWAHNSWSHLASGDDMIARYIEPCPECPPGGGTGWHVPFDAVYQRGINVREFIHEMWMPNGDHDPWTKGAPEIDLYFVGTSDTDANAELKTHFRVPVDGWLRESNSEPLNFGPYTLAVADWNTSYGTLIQVKCLEDDADLGEGTLSVSVTTQLSEAVSATAEASWSNELGGFDDNCGEAPLEIRDDPGSGFEWTPIFSADDDYRYWWHGTNDLRWNGYGLIYP